MSGQTKKQIGNQSHIDLCHYSVSRVPDECLYLKILFDPTEEDFYLPAVFVDVSNSFRRQFEIVRKKNIMGDVGAESSLRMNVEICTWFFPDDINRFTHEVLTPRYLATSAPEYLNSLTPYQIKTCLAFTTLCLRLPDRSSPADISYSLQTLSVNP